MERDAQTFKSPRRLGEDWNFAGNQQVCQWCADLTEFLLTILPKRDKTIPTMVSNGNKTERVIITVGVLPSNKITTDELTPASKLLNAAEKLLEDESFWSGFNRDTTAARRQLCSLLAKFCRTV